MDIELSDEVRLSDMYVYAYYSGEKIPDVTSLELRDGSVTVTITALPDKFTDWFRSLPKSGDVVLVMDNVALPIIRLGHMDLKVVGIKSAVDEFTEITILFS